MDLISTIHAATEAATETATEAAASAGGVAAIAGTFGLNGKLFLAQLVNFGLLVLVLWRLLYRPLVAHLEARRKRIVEGLENAKRYKEKLAELATERAGVLAEAEDEARRRLTAADQEALGIVTDGRARAEADATDIKARAASEIAQAKHEMLSEVRRVSADLVVLAAEKVIRQQLDDKADRKLVEQALKEVTL